MLDLVPSRRQLRPGTTGSPAAESGVKEPPFSVEKMDLAADASKDFYRYACGAWLDSNPVPADKSSWSIWDELQDRNSILLKEILEETVEGSAESGPAKQVGDFFASAIDRKHRDAMGFRPISSDLDHITRISSKESFARVLADIHQAGMPAFFRPLVAPDDKDSSVNALWLYQGGLALPDRDYYLKSRFASDREAYLSHIERMLCMLGESSAASQADVKAIMKIETILAKASRSSTAMRDPHRNYHRYSVEKLARRNPSFPWKLYFAQRGLSKIPWFVVGQPEFFDAIDDLVRSAPLKELKAYLRWQVLHWSAPYLHRKSDDEDFDFFHRRLLGQERPEQDWKRATTAVDQGLGEALGKLYVDRHFPPEAREKMVDLVRDLKSVFRDRLRTVPWMSEKTRELALVKFDRFTTKIGHPDVFRDYSSVRIRRDDYYGNVRRAAAFEARRKSAQIVKPVDRKEWHMTPPTVNAYFQPNFNEIVFPAGILQPPFFDLNMDDPVNLGAIGAVIGHEITHGYDDQGRKYDAEGRLRNWWSKADAKKFEERAKKMAREYSEFEALPGMKVNGLLTKGENIADLGGVSIAYEALQRRLMDGRTQRETIDGFSPEQRFFISFAQVWKTNIREGELRRLLTVDPHSPGRFRANGPLANMPEFWAAFNIPAGSSMRRPEKLRVKIW